MTTGIKPDEVKIEVEDGVLTVSGEHREESEEKKENYMRRERRYGSFSRSMALPQGVDAGDIVAKTRMASWRSPSRRRRPPGSSRSKSSRSPSS